MNYCNLKYFPSFPLLSSYLSVNWAVWISNFWPAYCNQHFY